MNTRFCPQCGAKHQWDIAKPKICVKCNKNMDTAFAASVEIKPIVEDLHKTDATAYQPPRTPRQQRRFYDSRGNDITHRFIRPEPERPQYNQGDEDYVDEYEKNSLAQQLAASISSEDFNVSVDEESNNKTIKLGSILKDVTISPPTSKTKSRKKKS